MEEEQPPTCNKKRKTDAKAEEIPMVQILLDRLLQMGSDMQSLRAEKDKWMQLAGGEGVEAERTRTEVQNVSELNMKRAQCELKMANDELEKAAKTIGSLDLRMTAMDAMIKDKNELLASTASAYSKIHDDVYARISERDDAIKSRDQWIKTLQEQLKTAQDAVQEKQRADGASVVKIRNELLRMFTGLNDVLNENGPKQTTPMGADGDDGGLAKTPMEIISVAKATLLEELRVADPKIKETLSGAWSGLVNSCTAKAHNIDRRCVERGVTAVCSLFRKKADPKYIPPATVGFFGTTPEQVSQRFLEMIGCDQSTWAHVTASIEKALEHVKPTPPT